MPFATGGGSSNITGAQVVDASLSVADLNAATLAAVSPTIKSLVMQPNFYPNGAITPLTVVTNTVLVVGQVIVEKQIICNAITFIAGGVTVAGTFKLALYSEDGQTQIFAVTSGSVTTNFQVVTTAVSAVTVNPGIYYLAVLPVGTANVTFPCYTYDTTNSVHLIANAVTGKPLVQGKITVTADTLPATISPTGITDTANCTVVMRLDN